MAEDSNLSSDVLGTVNMDQSQHRVVDKLSEICDKLNESDISHETKTRSLRQLLHVISNNNLSGVFRDGGLDLGEVEQLFTKLAKCLYDCSKIKQYTGREDVGYVASDFDGSAEIATSGMQCFCVILSKLPPNGDQPNKRIHKSIVFYAFMLSAEHTEETLWTSAASISLAGRLLQMVVGSCSTSVEKLLSGTEDRTGIFKDVLTFLQPRFMRTNWKQSPALKHVFQWCLLRVKFPELSNYLDHVLPASLLLLDDHEVTNQVMGVQCLDHIADNVSKTELSWYGRAEVIYDSLQKLTYSHEPELIRVLHPCLIKVLATVEMKSKDAQMISGYDEMFQRLLYNMEMETKLDARRAQSQHISLYVNTLGINTVKHFNQLFRVIFSFLEVFDGPHEVTRINILDALKVIILTCWPRIPNRCEQILKSLIKFLYETVSDRTVTPDDVKEKLIALTVECLLLLKQLCPQRTVPALNAVREVGLGSACTQHIDNVLAAE